MTIAEIYLREVDVLFKDMSLFGVIREMISVFFVTKITLIFELIRTQKRRAA